MKLDPDRRAPILLGAGAVAIIVAALLVTGTPPTRPSAGDGFRSIEDAVALGVLDQPVVDDIRGSGEAFAYVSIDVDEILVALQRQFPEVEQLLQRSEAFSTAVDSLLADLQGALGDDVVIVTKFDGLPTIGLRFRSESALLAALRLPFVSTVRANQVGEADVEQSTALVRSREVNDSGFEGQGTYVAVLDQGVDSSSTEYFPAGSVPERYRAKDLEDGNADGSATRFGHGTHVASTVLAVAPQTRIVDIEVFRDGSAGPKWSSGRILDGIRHIVALKNAYLADQTQCCNIVAMNLSLGVRGRHNETVCGDDFGFAAAYAVGIIPVTSAGNKALMPTEDDPDKEVFTPGIGYPACNPYAMNTGASTDGVFAAIDNATDTCEASIGVDRPGSFSQVGMPLRILAPGLCIAAAGGAWQGTSMAAPHVAGAVAILAAAKPDAGVEAIWEALTGTGQPITDTRHIPPITRNRLDVAAALAALTGGQIVDPVIITGGNVVVGPSTIQVASPLSTGRKHAIGEIAVRNIGTGTATFEMVAGAPDLQLVDPASPDWFEFSDATFTLEAGDVRVVTVTVEIPSLAVAGAYGALIRPTDTSGNASESDPRVRVTFDIGQGGGSPGGGGPGGGSPEDGSPSPFVALVIIAAVAVVGWLWLRKRRRSA